MNYVTKKIDNKWFLYESYGHKRNKSLMLVCHFGFNSKEEALEHGRKIYLLNN